MNPRRGLLPFVATALGRLRRREGPSGRRKAMQLKWSRRWYEDPVPGTEVCLGDGLVEIYIGNEIWETIPAGDAGD